MELLIRKVCGSRGRVHVYQTTTIAPFASRHYRATSSISSAFLHNISGGCFARAWGKTRPTSGIGIISILILERPQLLGARSQKTWNALISVSGLIVGANLYAQNLSIAERVRTYCAIVVSAASATRSPWWRLMKNDPRAPKYTTGVV